MLVCFCFVFLILFNACKYFKRPLGNQLPKCVEGLPFLNKSHNNKLIRSNQLKAVKQKNKNQNCGSKRWWSLVNKITGRGNCEVPLSHIIDPKVMNEHFQTINTDPDYVTPQPLPISRGTKST